MNEHTQHLVAILTSGLVVTLSVVLHYEALRFLGRTLGRHVHKRIGMLLIMLGLLIAHILEIWVFAIGYMILQHGASLGYIAGMEKGNLMDYGTVSK